MKPSELSLSLVIPLQGRWATVDQHGCTSSQLWSHYLACCGRPGGDEEILAAAILIESNGAPWNSTQHSESFLHIGSWLRAAADLLEGADSAGVWAWEESNLKMKRQGPLVILEEATHHSALVLPPVCFCLLDFSRALALAARPALQLLSGLPELAAREFPAEWAGFQKADLSDQYRVQDSELALDEFRQREKALLAELQVAPPRQVQAQALARQDLLEFLSSEDFLRLQEDAQRLRDLLQ